MPTMPYRLYPWAPDIRGVPMRALRRQALFDVGYIDPDHTMEGSQDVGLDFGARTSASARIARSLGQLRVAAAGRRPQTLI